MGSIDVLSELARLVTEGAITERALEAMTGIDAAKLHAARRDDRRGSEGPIGLTRRVFTTDETVRISMLAGQLAEGMTVEDDDRLKSILESLTAELHLTTANIARLTGTHVEDVERALDDPRSLAVEVKYALGIRTSYLVNAINLARAR